MNGAHETLFPRTWECECRFVGLSCCDGGFVRFAGRREISYDRVHCAVISGEVHSITSSESHVRLCHQHTQGGHRGIPE